jgi:hypothetical protein
MRTHSATHCICPQGHRKLQGCLEAAASSSMQATICPSCGQVAGTRNAVIVPSTFHGFPSISKVVPFLISFDVNRTVTFRKFPHCKIKVVVQVRVQQAHARAQQEKQSVAYSKTCTAGLGRIVHAPATKMDDTQKACSLLVCTPASAALSEELFSHANTSFTFQPSPYLQGGILLFKNEPEMHESRALQEDSARGNFTISQGNCFIDQ